MSDLRTWDKNIKIGSIVFNGCNYCKVVGIKERKMFDNGIEVDDYPLIDVIIIVSKSGKVMKSKKVHTFHVCFLNLITEKLLNDERNFELDLIDKKYDYLFAEIRKANNG